MEGRQLRLPVQLGRRYPEAVNTKVAKFYRRLLTSLQHPVFHEGKWRLLSPYALGQDNAGDNKIVAYQWLGRGARRVVAVSLSPDPLRCVIRPEMPDLPGQRWRLRDLLSGNQRSYEGQQLSSCGLELSMKPYEYCLLAIEHAPS
jgi:hypothetical protein